MPDRSAHSGSPPDWQRDIRARDAAALVAVALPARRAAGINPIEALRNE